MIIIFLFFLIIIVIYFKNSSTARPAEAVVLKTKTTIGISKDINLLRLLNYVHKIIIIGGGGDIDTFRDLKETCRNVLLLQYTKNKDGLKLGFFDGSISGNYDMARQQSLLAIEYLSALKYSVHSELVGKVDEAVFRLRLLLSRHVGPLSDINIVRVPASQATSKVRLQNLS